MYAFTIRFLVCYNFCFCIFCHTNVSGFQFYALEVTSFGYDTGGPPLKDSLYQQKICNTGQGRKRNVTYSVSAKITS